MRDGSREILPRRSQHQHAAKERIEGGRLGSPLQLGDSGLPRADQAGEICLAERVLLASLANRLRESDLHLDQFLLGLRQAEQLPHGAKREASRFKASLTIR